jgi:hypothetical protein
MLSLLQSDLDKLEKWETSWLTAFHPEKCNVLTITKKRNPIKFKYTLHGHSLEHVTSAKYLGCTITSDDLSDVSYSSSLYPF